MLYAIHDLKGKERVEALNVKLSKTDVDNLKS